LDEIRLLTEDLIESRPDLAMEVLATSSRLSIPLGWHYLLDLIWILAGIESDGLPAGSTVVDLGAGVGVLQFILAERGYRVISADMTDRTPSRAMRALFGFEAIDCGTPIEHSYLPRFAPPARGLARRTLSALRHPRRLLRSLRGAPPAETPRSPAGRPTITWYRCDLAAMEHLAEASVAAVVSVSALEHNPPEAVPRIIAEAERFLAPGGTMRLTVSGAVGAPAYDDESHSWLLDEAGLLEAYGLVAPSSDYPCRDAVIAGLCASRYLKRWLTAAYFFSDQNGMPWGRWNPTYLPIGICKRSRTSRRQRS
jgi:SAM-dependent methyltransferase